MKKASAPARNYSKISRDWWDYTTLDRKILDAAAKLTLDDLPKLQRKGFKINIYDILSDYTQTINNPHIISLECPECHHSMVFLDKSIAKSIAVLNSLGIYPEYSCDGREDQQAHGWVH